MFYKFSFLLLFSSLFYIFYFYFSLHFLLHSLLISSSSSDFRVLGYSVKRSRIQCVQFRGINLVTQWVFGSHIFLGILLQQCQFFIYYKDIIKCFQGFSNALVSQFYHFTNNAIFSKVFFVLHTFQGGFNFLLCYIRKFL